MPNRVILDTIYTSDKLAACNNATAVELCLGDLSKLLYAYLLIPQQDDIACMELNLWVFRGICFSRFTQPLSIETIRKVLEEWNHNGLLFVWEENGKLWGHVTGAEKLPAPSRRWRRRTPDPPKKEMAYYEKHYPSLQTASTGLLKGFKVVQSASASLRTASASLRQPSKGLRKPTTRIRGPTNTYGAPTKACTELEPELEREQQVSRSASSSSADKTTQMRVQTDGAKKKLQQLTQEKRLNRARDKNSDLRNQLMAGIYRIHLFDYYDNAYRRCGSLRRLAEELTQKCSSLLLTNRGAIELVDVEHEKLAAAAWPIVKRGLPIIEQVKNYETRKHQLGGHIMNAVVDAALQLKK